MTAEEARKITHQATQSAFKEYDKQFEDILKHIKAHAMKGFDWVTFTVGDVGGPYIKGKLQALGYNVVGISSTKYEVQW